jgi:hypothetical protein
MHNLNREKSRPKIWSTFGIKTGQRKLSPKISQSGHPDGQAPQIESVIFVAEQSKLAANGIQQRTARIDRAAQIGRWK